MFLILLVSAAALVFASFLARWWKTPFEWWFSDTWQLLLIETIFLMLLAAIWDSALICAGTFRQFMPGATMRSRQFPPAIWQRLGCFNLGVWPLLTVLAASCGAIGTSGITLINLALLQQQPDWRDPALWNIEAPLFQWLSLHPVNPLWWDRLYHSAWGIELLVVFILAVLARDNRKVAQFCLSFVLLFYFGRFLGLLNPVMGPAFFKPEIFHYLQGSFSGAAMHLVGQVMTDPSISKRSAVLLGGVSAMPSLHVGMVALSAYWLWSVARWTAIVTIPWVVLVWTATVLLGWHYAVDGIGGVILAFSCIALSRRLI